MGLPGGNVCVPPNTGNVTSNCDAFRGQIQKEHDWLQHVNETYMADITPESNISWAAYHASQLPPSRILSSINAMPPLFSDEACSPAKICHCLHVIGAAIRHVNPDQVPVICLDQPLYALAKQIQRSIPGDYGENKYIMLLGGLHIELTAFTALGHWLEGSGWVESLPRS